MRSLVIRCLTVAAVLAVAVAISGLSVSQATATDPLAPDNVLPALQGPSGDQVILVPGTVSPGPVVENALRSAIAGSLRSLPASSAYAIAALYQDGSWYFVSVVGLNKPDVGGNWSLLQDADWFGLVLLHHNSDGAWSGAAEGTAEFSYLLGTVPNKVLDPAARLDMDPLQRHARATSMGYRFPFTAGTQMQYGARGLHNGDFEGWAGIHGWKAVDLVSDGNVAAGHASSTLLAAAAGSVAAVCNDGTSVAIRVGDLLYAHLLNNANLRTGHAFAQGEALGQLRTGGFQANCGWASQGDGWFHVHWAFPATSDFQVEDWTLSMADGLWRRGSETRGIGSWLQSGDTTPPDGDYTAPIGGQVVTGTVRLQGVASDAGSGLQRAHFTARWSGQWHQVGPDLTSSPFAYTWDLCAAAVPDGDVELGLDIWDKAGNTASSPHGTRHITKSYDCNAPPPLTAPQPSAPAYRASLPPDVDLNLEWRSLQGATEYLAELWGGPDNGVRPCGWSPAARCHVGPVVAGYTYFWHVKARNRGGESDWSASWPFRVDELKVLESLSLSTPSLPAGQAVTARFRLKNLTSRPISLRRVVVAAYGPNCTPANCVDWINFPHDDNIVLAPGQEYAYSQQQTFVIPGSYTARIVIQDSTGIWRSGFAGAGEAVFVVPASRQVVQGPPSGREPALLGG